MKFSWWAGQSDEHFSINENTREDVIERGRAEFDGEGFHIVEASQDKDFSFPDGGRLWEQFIEGNEDLGGEDNYFGEDVTVTPEQEKELGDAFKALFEGWMERHKLEPYVYVFTATRNNEFIPGTNPDPDEARDDRDELARLAKENTDDGT